MVFGLIVISAGFVMSYMKFNHKKEEKERKRGYPVETKENILSGERLNIRMLLARCIYGMQYRARGRSDKTCKSWWEPVGYDIVSINTVLGDDCQEFRAELKKEARHQYFGVFQKKYRIDNGAPEWIVAIRGTEISKLTDLIKDAKIFLEILRKDSFKLLHAVVERLIKKHKPANVLITGYSLGAAAAMLVGRNFAEEGIYVEAHLFNPPYFTFTDLFRRASRLRTSVRSEIKGHMGKILIKFSDFVTLNLRSIAVGTVQTPEDLDKRFSSLARWAPHIYVNTADLICQRYVGHFKIYKHRKHDSPRLDSFHLLPRAVLHICTRHAKSSFISAHMLWNWLRADNPYIGKEENILGENFYVNLPDLVE